jgi:hypothetical protein
MKNLVIRNFIALGFISMMASPAHAATALFLGDELATGNPALDPAFTSWLGTNALISSDLAAQSIGSGGDKAVWSQITAPVSGVSSTTLSWLGIGGASTVSVPVTSVGWDNATNALTGSGTTTLLGAGLNGTSLQSASPRPGFASGGSSGYYLATSGGSTSDNVRNAVKFDFTNFSGGGIYSFGIFAGDLETGNNLNTAGALTGSIGVRGFLYLTFTDPLIPAQRVDYTPTASLAAAATFTGNNHTNDGYGNNTGRFIGFSSDDKKIATAVFVVGDDDKVAVGEGNGDNEQLSFIAPITFLSSLGVPVVPSAVPEPSSLVVALLGLVTLLVRRR